ncbi:MAG: TIGR04086 family membrane protein [Clostridia bacterium]|nr:TIGR04086 family membrane protein [Clostridia bacterium]
MTAFKYKSMKKSVVSAYIVGLSIGLMITLLSIFLFAAVYMLSELAEYYNAVFATLSLIIGSYCGAAFTVSKINQNGFLNGIILGVLIFVSVFVVSFIVSGNSVSLTSVFHLVCCALSGGISGIVRVNKEKNKKYLK